MKVLNSFYQYINILSLDVVAGAAISALFFARIFDVAVSLCVILALAVTVWIIYTLDHLRDATSIPRIASTDRHRFHQKYFRVILLILLIALLIDFVLIWFVPPGVFKAGIALWFIVMLYLVVQRYLKFLKEFFVACLYTAGVLLPSVAMLIREVQPVHYLLAGKFFITALMNLLLFSLFDYNQDRSQQQHSFVTWFGPASTRYGIIFLGMLNIASGLWIWDFSSRIALIFISMNLVLLAIIVFEKQLIANNYFRILGDAIFFIPLLYFL